MVLQLHSTYESNYDQTLGSAYFHSYPEYNDTDYYSDYGYGGSINELIMTEINLVGL